MFGLKILSKKEYRRLKEAERLCEHFKELEQSIDEHVKDQLSSLNGLVVLKGNSYPCEKCNLESDHCRKLHFADRTICVTAKEYVNLFKKGRK